MPVVGLGVRELKARLSHHLRQAQAGAIVTITDRGKPIAILGPAETRADVAWARALVAEGLAGWRGGKPVGLVPRVRNRRKTASAMILEGRR